MKLACRCGQVQGECDPARAYTRATCYCRDCRAFARWLGDGGLLDAAGGSDIVPMAPDGVRFTAGQEHLACMSLGPRGLLRWYAACCHTPLANVPRDPKFFYLGLPVACLDAPETAVSAAFGPGGRVALSTESATAPVTPTRWALLGGIVKIVANVVGARLRGRRNGLLFAEDGAPIRPVQVLTLEQRRALADA